MTLAYSQKLDEILKAFNVAPVQTFPYSSMEEKMELTQLLNVLKNDGYISKYGIGGGGKEIPVFISPNGRAFIANGGYSATAQKEQKKEEEDSLRLEYLKVAKRVAESQVDESRGKKRSKYAWLVLLLASAIYFYLTKDDNKDMWGSINTYLSIIASVTSVIGYFRS